MSSPSANTPENLQIAPIAPIALLQQERQERGRSEAVAPPVLLLVLACVVIPAIVAYGFATADELQVLAVMMAGIGLIAILARPIWGLLFFVGLLYVRPEESLPALAGMHFTLVVALVTLIGMWFQLFLNHQPFVRTPLSGMMLCFCFVAVASSLNNGNSADTLMDLSRLLVLVLLIINLIRAPEHYRWLVTAILIFTGYLAVYSIYLLQSGDIVYQDGIERSKATGIFGDPNDLASVFVAALALVLVRVVNSGKVGRVLYLLLAALLLYATFVTNSRGATLSMLVVVGGLMLGFLRRRPLIAVLAVLAGFLLLGVSGRMTTFDSTEASANQRFWYWDNGLTLMRENPVLGIGYSKFIDANGGMTAHNSFVLCFAELGLLGFFFWMGCLYYCYRKRPAAVAAAAETEAAAPTSSTSAALDLFAARLCLAAYLMASFWLSHTYSPILYLLICLPVSAQIAWREGSEEPPITGAERMRDWGRIAALCAGSIVLINLMVWHYR